MSGKVNLDRWGPHLAAAEHEGSWLNLIEQWLGLLSQRQIKRGSHRSTVELEQTIRHYLAVYNKNSTPFVWHMSADQTIESVGRLCSRINDSVH